MAGFPISAHNLRRVAPNPQDIHGLSAIVAVSQTVATSTTGQPDESGHTIPLLAGSSFSGFVVVVVFVVIVRVTVGFGCFIVG